MPKPPSDRYIRFPPAPTPTAREETAKPGLFPIELVDDERLQLGARPRIVFDVDDRVFDEYR